MAKMFESRQSSFDNRRATGTTTARKAVSREAIARRAYEKFLARGCQHGFDQQDWLEAERELQNQN
ncbi:MAG: DUF2934 domain-containing protein [Candidatus Omnitrophica bacterium]|nr:DUF2934 domain-containing protein [Candidatus Omnitrophota bacterium]